MIELQVMRLGYCYTSNCNAKCGHHTPHDLGHLINLLMSHTTQSNSVQYAAAGLCLIPWSNIPAKH
jgi:hypothetical protein